MKKTDWTASVQKCQSEGKCRFCGALPQDVYCIEQAHVIARSRVSRPHGWVIRSAEIVPLCGPRVNTGTCHNLYDDHKLDLWSVMTDEERECAVDVVTMGNQKSNPRMDYAHEAERLCRGVAKER